MKTHFYILRFSSMCFCEPVQSLLAFPVFNFVLLTPPAILSRLWWKKNKKQKTNLKKKAGWGDLPLYPHMNSLYLKENMQRPQRFKKHSSHSSWWVFKKKKKKNLRCSYREENMMINQQRQQYPSQWNQNFSLNEKLHHEGDILRSLSISTTNRGEEL